MSNKLPTIEVDLVELVRSGTHYAERRGEFVHTIEVRSGRTIAVHHLESGLPLEFTEETLPDGTVISRQKDLFDYVANKREVLYSPLIIDLMCQEIASGKGITDVCKMPHFPTYATLSRWRRTHPEIDEALSRAKLDRAEYHRDEVVRQAYSKEGSLDSRKFKAEVNKYAAAVDDPTKYSPKSKPDVQVNLPTQIIVQTGIERDEK